MIAYLRGKIKYLGPNWIILDVNGVGYKIYIPKVTSYKLHATSEFYIYHHIREDRSELYGFSEMEDLQTFELLLGVSGIGPKIAANIISKTGREKLQQAIGKGDTTLFTAISGVGKKMAMKIIIELKNKTIENISDITGLSESSQELVGAMESLGYKKPEIYPLLSKMPNNLKDTQEKIKWMLKKSKR